MSFENSLNVTRAEKLITEYGGVIYDNNIAYAVTREGDAVPVPDSVAEMIKLALRLQEKVDTGKYPNLAKLFHIMNCRKTALVSGGRMSVQDATRIKEDVNEMAGYEELFTDVERIQESGYVPVVDSFNDMSVETLYDEYEGAFPCITHVFEADTGSELISQIDDELFKKDVLNVDLVRQLHRIHSFVVLGTDREGEKYICFQKSGSGLASHFEVVSLDEVGRLYFAEEDRTDVTFVGPLL